MTMTREQRLIEAIRVAKEAEAKAHRRTLKAEATVRAEERKALAQRRDWVTQLLEQAGVLQWSDDELAALCAVLALCTCGAHRAGMLEGLRTGHNGTVEHSEDMAGVSPSRSLVAD